MPLSDDPTSTATPPPRVRRRTLLLLAVVALVVAPSAALANHLFADVDDGYVHAPGVSYLADTGVTQGCATAPDRFCPTDALTRGQMATFLYRGSGNDPATPPSVNAASIAEVEVVTASNNVFGSAVNTASVTCPEGTVVTGGGAQTSSAQSWHQAFSRPTNDGTGWTAQHVQEDGLMGVNTTTVWAMCVAVGGS